MNPKIIKLVYLSTKEHNNETYHIIELHYTDGTSETSEYLSDKVVNSIIERSNPLVQHKVEKQETILQKLFKFLSISE